MPAAHAFDAADGARRPMTDKKSARRRILSARQPVPRIHARRHEEILEAVAYANVPAANVHAADAALLVANVQGNVFDWVELQTGTVGEAVVAVATFVTTSLGVVDVFAVANTDHTVDARPVVEAVSWTCGDGIVLRFLVETVFRTIFSRWVKEPITPSGLLSNS